MLRGGDAACSVLLEVVEETAHEHRVEIREVHLGGPLSGLRRGVGEEQPEGMAVGVDGVRAGVSLAAEPVDEERLQRGGEGGHRRLSLLLRGPLARERQQLRDGRQVPVRGRRHQRIAKLFLTAVLGPFERVEDLYIHPELYKRPRRPSRGSENV